MPASVGVITLLVVVGFDTAFGAAVTVGAIVLTVLVGFGLGAFGVDTAGVVGVPNFLAFCVFPRR